jgi:hypothetical protein
MLGFSANCEQIYAIFPDETVLPPNININLTWSFADAALSDNSRTLRPARRSMKKGRINKILPFLFGWCRRSCPCFSAGAYSSSVSV